MSYNKFNQNTPDLLLRFAQLCQLDLSHNYLEGEIPSNIDIVQNLVMLNISHNISGEIPSSFEDMKWLMYANVSFNQLQGPIPNSAAFLQAPIEALEGNKGLCGNQIGMTQCSRASKKHHHVLASRIYVISFIFGSLGAVPFIFIVIYLINGRKKYSQGEQIIEKGEIHQQGEVHEDDLPIQSSAEGKKLFDEIIQVTEDFHNKFGIGTGGAGSVYKVQLESIGNIAVKKLHALPDGREYDKESLKELQALEGTRYRKIVKLYGYYIHRRVSFFIYEYFEKGSLANVLRNEDTARGLNWSSRFKLIKGVAAALSYTHHDCKKQFIYRDINSKNILLDDE